MIGSQIHVLNADLPQYQKLGQVPKGLYILVLPCKDFFLKHPREYLLLGEMTLFRHSAGIPISTWKKCSLTPSSRGNRTH